MTDRLTICVLVMLLCAVPARAADVIPALGALKADRPRVLIRPRDTPHAISLKQLRAVPRDEDVTYALNKLTRQKSAAAQAMVWLLTGDTAAADKAVARMRGYDNPAGKGGPFAVYFRLREFALAYDWLHTYKGFPRAVKGEVRRKLAPLAATGMRISDDHIFHNYVWNSAGGVGLWALATAGDDAEATRLYRRIRARLNERLYPGWKYLDGQPGESMGYWALYDLSPGALVLLAAQSAAEIDVMERIRRDGDWLDRQYQYLIHVTTPAMKYLTWGDSRWGQPDNGVTHEMAGVSDGLAWALRSPTGVYFSRWMARSKRGMRRFYGETAMFYLLYTRHLRTKPKNPPLSILAGGEHGGHWIARSAWTPDATIVGFRCTDFFGNHNHFDQGSFIIYRKGLLATDPPVYPKVHAGQEKTEYHNTLLIGEKGQRRARGQEFATLAAFKKALTERGLETGDVLFHKEAGGWAAVAGQFAQAYPEGLLASCVRQVLFLRPDTVLVADHLRAPAGADPVKVQWLLQLPKQPTQRQGVIAATNGESWLRCRPVVPGPSIPKIDKTWAKTHRAAYTYELKRALTLLHVLDVGDGTRPVKAPEVRTKSTKLGLYLTLGGRTFLFDNRDPFAVSLVNDDG
ncbi:MAG: heparinase II/III family protein [Planctomycetota bacterium]